MMLCEKEEELGRILYIQSLAPFRTDMDLPRGVPLNPGQEVGVDVRCNQDTLDIRPLPGIVLKHFTAHDVISRRNVIGAYPRSTAANAVHFLNALEQRLKLIDMVYT